MSELSIQFLESDFDKVSYLVNLLTARATGLHAEPGEFVQLRNQLLSNPQLRAILPRWLCQCRTLDTFWAYIQPMFETYAQRRAYLSEEFTPALDALEFGQPPQAVETPAQSSVSTAPTVARNKRKVFIVHGRDNEAKLEVARFIEGIGLEAIILHEQASNGMTIIEKIEYYSNDADFAIVLYTACDHGRGVHESNVPHRDRARQNVVFEHGYLMAKLGRENVCPLVKADIETPNDVSGMVYVELDVYGAWKNKVANELRACGYVINNTINHGAY